MQTHKDVSDKFINLSLEPYSMRTIHIILIISISTLLFTHVFAHEVISAPEDVVNSIMTKQGASSTSQIDCKKVSQDDFEELGDALMERMAGSHELHEQMDAMMGGEGSASLQQMHVAMGSNWLGCTSVTSQGVMNINMMPMMMRMMGNYYPAYYSDYDIVLLLAIVGWVLFIITLAYFYATRKRRKKS